MGVKDKASSYSSLASLGQVAPASIQRLIEDTIAWSLLRAIDRLVDALIPAISQVITVSGKTSDGGVSPTKNH